MLDLKELKEQKQKLGCDNHTLSVLTGLPAEELEQIFEGTSAPDYSTLTLLNSLLSPPAPGVKEASPELVRQLQRGSIFPFSSARQGHYTIKDYYQLPDNIRVELIDGVFYYMSAPSALHQLISGFVYTKMMNFVLAGKGPCTPFISPIDVQLDCDEKTMVQPDVIILCDPSKNINRCIYGAPDFVMEVLSPSTKKKDLTIKFQKYQNAGVREYWIADPCLEKLFVYFLEKDPSPVVYDFTDKVPVEIWNRELEIDLKELQEFLRRFSNFPK